MIENLRQMNNFSSSDLQVLYQGNHLLDYSEVFTRHLNSTDMGAIIYSHTTAMNRLAGSVGSFQKVVLAEPEQLPDLWQPEMAEL